MSTRTSVNRTAREPIRVLELRSVRGTGGGPEKTILLGAQRADSGIQTVVCYIRDERDQVFGIDARAAALGVDYVEVRERQSFDLSAWSRVRRLVLDRRIDIVHAHEYKTDLLAWWLARTTGVLPMSTVHGWSGESFRELYVYYPADRLVLTRFPRVVTVSTDLRDRLLRSGAKPERVSTILNGIDHTAFRRDRSREAACKAAMGFTTADVVVGTVGRLEPGKGLEMLLNAVAEVRSTRPEVRLAIVGDGSLRAPLEERARALFPPGACVFTGKQSDIVPAHHAFDLFVHPSDHEGTPNAVLEAMALETPVVATNAGGTGELLHHNVHGVIVPCKDEPALTRAIATALLDTTTTTSRAAAARRRTEHALSFETRMRAVEDIYRQLIAERSGLPGLRPVQAA
jgi:glycosyltransferase involved in cell wall biosynthesis